MTNIEAIVCAALAYNAAARQHIAAGSEACAPVVAQTRAILDRCIADYAGASTTAEKPAENGTALLGKADDAEEPNGLDASDLSDFETVAPEGAVEHTETPQPLKPNASKRLVGLHYDAPAAEMRQTCVNAILDLQNAGRVDDIVRILSALSVDRLTDLPDFALTRAFNLLSQAAIDADLQVRFAA